MPSSVVTCGLAAPDPAQPAFAGGDNGPAEVGAGDGAADGPAAAAGADGPGPPSRTASTGCRFAGCRNGPAVAIVAATTQASAKAPRTPVRRRVRRCRRP